MIFTFVSGLTLVPKYTLALGVSMFIGAFGNVILKGIIKRIAINSQIKYLHFAEYLFSITGENNRTAIITTDIESVISKIEKSLKNGGHFYCSFKYGDFEGERNGRFFNDYTEESTKQLFAKFSTFGLVDMWITSDARPDRDEKWVNCVWVKK